MENRDLKMAWLKAGIRGGNGTPGVAWLGVNIGRDLLGASNKGDLLEASIGRCNGMSPEAGNEDNETPPVWRRLFED